MSDMRTAFDPNEGKEIGVAPRTSCREYHGYRASRGYGYVSGERSVHRLIMEMAVGRKLERSEIVLHLCDNPPCFRFDHLYLGTHSDNMRDMSLKGRAGMSAAKLTPRQVAEIADRLTGDPNESTKLANEYKVSRATINRIRNGATWMGVGKLAGYTPYGDGDSCTHGHVGEYTRSKSGYLYCRACLREKARRRRQAFKGEW